MKVIWEQQASRLFTKTEDPIKVINSVARVCYQSEVPSDKSAQIKFIKTLIERNHDSPLEFVDFTWYITTSRAIANELVRHRIASYMQESTRFVKYDEIRLLTPIQDKHSYTTKSLDPEKIEKMMDCYKELLEAGIAKEFARDFLPLGLVTHLYCKMNLREFRHFLKLRTSPSAHIQIHNLAFQMLLDLKCAYPKEVFETLFFDFLFLNENL